MLIISINKIKQLREETAVSITECKKALIESKGDIEIAKKILRKWGKELAGKKSQKETGEGIVETYVHPNKKIGVMIEICCQSDFVAKSQDFQKIAHELCLQIAAMKPLFLNETDIPNEFLNEEKKIYQEQFKNSDKPQKIIDQIIEGKLNKYKKTVSLLSQIWIKDEKRTIKDLLNEYIAKLGENIVIKKFIRYEI